MMQVLPRWSKTSAGACKSARVPGVCEHRQLKFPSELTLLSGDPCGCTQEGLLARELKLTEVDGSATFGCGTDPAGQCPRRSRKLRIKGCPGGVDSDRNTFNMVPEVMGCAKMRRTSPQQRIWGPTVPMARGVVKPGGLQGS